MHKHSFQFERSANVKDSFQKNADRNCFFKKVREGKDMLIKWNSLKKKFVIIIILAMLCGIFMQMTCTSVLAADPVTYYISSSSGNDNNNGTSTSTPWSTLAKVSSKTFNPGDKVLLKRCDIWNEGVVMHGSGTSGNYIELGAYGTGARPMINMSDDSQQFCVKWMGVSYCKVDSISVCNAGQGIRVEAISSLSDGYNIIDDCIAYNIHGLYWEQLPEGAEFTSAIHTSGTGSQISNCEVFRGGGNVGIFGYDCTVQNLYIHELDDQNTVFQSLVAAGGHYTFKNIVVENEPWYAPSGTAGIGLGCYENPPLSSAYSLFDHIIFRNVKWNGFAPGDTAGIDFEVNARYLTIQNSVFENIGGAAIEFLRGGAENLTSNDIEIKNNKFINCNYERPYPGSYSAIQVVNWLSPNKPTNISIHDNDYILASGNTAFFGGDGDTSGCTVTNNTSRSSIIYDHEPTVEAGADKNIYGTSSATLSDASASDDDQSITVKWEQFMGPNGAQATFNNDSTINPIVTFPQDGTYILRLKASDTNYFKTDYVTVKVDNASVRTLTDEMDDHSKLYSHTANLAIENDSAYSYFFGGDTTRLSRTTTSNENVIYNTPGDMTSFNLDSYFWDNDVTGGLTFYTSPNNSTYTVLTPSISNQGAQGYTGWTKYVYNSSSLPSGTRYLRVVLSGATYAWNPKISRLNINYNYSGASIQNLKTWDFNTNGDAQGWTVGNQVNNVSVNNGYYTANVAGANPQINSPDNLRIDLTTNKFITICMKNNTSATVGKLYFTTYDDTTFDENKVIHFDLIPNDSIYRVYKLDFGHVRSTSANLLGRGRGIIKQLRLDPEVGASSGSFSIDYLRSKQSGPMPVSALEYYFNTDGSAQGWTVGNQIANMGVYSGCYYGSVTGTDPWLYSPDNLNIDISRNKLIQICLKNDTNSTSGTLYFTTSNDTTWNAAKCLSITLNAANDSIRRVYDIDMSSVSGWTGTLKQLRIDPEEGATSGTFGIEFVRILPVYNKTWNFNTDGNAEGWTVGNQVNNVNVANGYYTGNITGSDPWIYSPDNLNFDTSKAKTVIIRLKNSTSSNNASLYFTTTTDQTWDGNKSMAINITPNSDYTTYVLDMWTNPYWTGTLKQLRIDPEEGAATGSFSIDYAVVKNR